MEAGKLEKYSSAITLSDMEIFVFPELMYSLVLANIMSPVIWSWREEDCFKKLRGKTRYRKLMRLKQYIMDEFDFNLDLETWGLTLRQRELERFKDFLAPEDIAASNALFGYHGDKYYFDVDIRRHFGLDKYDSDIIPYWKTETVEAMKAFERKEDYKKAAGECVSLAALYAAAAFVVCEIPLEDIYMILTPLHSQNFIDLKGGILTNNRRLVTKTMWFNGTEISNKAQRALRNEQVTIVAHNSGHVHCLYDDATISRERYEQFADKLQSYLTTDLTMELIASFLRCHHEYQQFFQVCRDCHGQARYLKAEILFHYEHGSPHKIGCHSHDKLLEEVSDEDLVPFPWPGRVQCDILEAFLEKERPDVTTSKGRSTLETFFGNAIPDTRPFVESLARFAHMQPRLPGFDKTFSPARQIDIDAGRGRRNIIEHLRTLRPDNTTVDLAFYAYREMDTCNWRPFVKAAIERNPVAIEASGNLDLDQVYQWLQDMPDESIYDGPRLAQPDEVVNYGTGDGLEKAFVLANVIRSGRPDDAVQLSVDSEQVVVSGANQYPFRSAKRLDQRIRIKPDGTIETDS